MGNTHRNHQHKKKNAVDNCLTFDKHEDCLAFSLACANTGKSMAAKIAIIAITTNNSIKVKPFLNIECSSFFFVLNHIKRL